MIKRVRCIDEGGNVYLTKGKIYEIEDNKKVFYRIKNDDNSICVYSPKFFEDALKYPNPPKVHAELIKAWAEGADIEYLLRYPPEWRYCKKPGWEDHVEYRIKPTFPYEKLGHLNRKLGQLEKGMSNLEIQIKEVKTEIGDIQCPSEK